jgi:hypothetical protein
MGFIILKILVINFFCLFSSITGFISSEVSLFSDLFVSSSGSYGFQQHETERERVRRERKLAVQLRRRRTREEKEKIGDRERRETMVF